MKKILLGLVALVCALFVLVEPAEAATTPSISYRTHVQNIGWQGYVKDGATAGTTGKSLRLEAINIKLENLPVSGGIQYETHIQNIGWQGFVANNAQSGTTGKSLRLEAIRIKLTGELANQYDVYYRVHIQNSGWLNWAKNGVSAGSEGLSRRLEAIQIRLVKIGAAAPTNLAQTVTVASTATANKFYAVKQDIRTDELLENVPSANNSSISSAKTFHKTIIQSDKFVKLTNGQKYVHVKINNVWKWILEDGLSWEKTLPTPSQPIMAYNSYNTAGQIVYYSNSKYSAQLDQAATYLNQVLGETVLVKTTNSTASNMTLKVTDVQNGTTGASAYLMGTYPYQGLMFVNTSFIGLNKNGYNYASSLIIKNIFIHELAHALGLDHTGSDGATWSWSTQSDIMWAQCYSNITLSFTSQDIAAAKLVRTLRMFYGTAKPAIYSEVIKKSVVADSNDPSDYFVVIYPGEYEGEVYE